MEILIIFLKNCVIEKLNDINIYYSSTFCLDQMNKHISFG